jgi:hypothetical protein
MTSNGAWLVLVILLVVFAALGVWLSGTWNCC